MQYERLNYSKNWNNKLLCNIFTTIRPVNSKYSLEEVLDVRIDDKHFCYAKVLRTDTKSIAEIINSGFYLTDTGLSKEDFFEFMSKMYSKKSWWKGDLTEMKIVFLEKIIQLTLFEDGKYPVA